MSDAVGQPPPGKRASSALRPVDQTGRDGDWRWPRRWPAEASQELKDNFQTRASARRLPSVGTSRGIHVFTAAKHPDHHPFDHHRLFFQIDANGFEIGVLGQEPYDGALLPIALDGHLVLEAG